MLTAGRWAATGPPSVTAGREPRQGTPPRMFSLDLAYGGHGTKDANIEAVIAESAGQLGSRVNLIGNYQSGGLAVI